MNERIRLNFTVTEGDAIQKLIVSSHESIQTDIKNINLIPEANIGLSMMVSQMCDNLGVEFGEASFSLGERCFYLDEIGPVRTVGNVELDHVSFEVMSMDALYKLNQCIGKSYFGVMLNDEEESEFDI